MSFTESIATVFRKYADFRGYASRPEYWWFVLFYTIVWIVTRLLDAGVGAAIHSSGFALFNTIWVLGILLPGLALAVRRLRDAGYAWPWIFILLVPIAGAIVFVVLVCMPTKQRVPVPAGSYAPMA